MNRLKDKLNGNAPMVVSVASMLISMIVGLTVIFGNPMEAASRNEVKEELRIVEERIGERLGRMEGRLNRRIDDKHGGN